jgi:hypothetical protein
MLGKAPLSPSHVRSGEDSRIANDDNPEVLKALCMPDETTADVAFDLFLVAENVAFVVRPLEVRVHHEPQSLLVSIGKRRGTAACRFNHFLLGRAALGHATTLPDQRVPSGTPEPPPPAPTEPKPCRATTTHTWCTDRRVPCGAA